MSARDHERGGIVAYAPGSIGNLGPGLDVLGCALTGLGDEVHAWWTDGPPGVTIVDAGHPELSTDPARHACAIAVQAVLDRSAPVARGLALAVTKGIPLAGGQGGSAASAVAAAVAVNQLIIHAGGVGLNAAGLLEASLVAESTVAGRHLDNVAPSLLGGVTCVLALDPPDVVPVPVKTPLWFALALPDIQLRTADARAALPPSVPRDVVVRQLANVAALVTGLASGDLSLVGRALVDHIAEPVRAALVPGFAEAKAAALRAGALGASLSGSGPTTFAACASVETARLAADAMRDAYVSAGRACSVRIATIDFDGSRWRHA